MMEKQTGMQAATDEAQASGVSWGYRWWGRPISLDFSASGIWCGYGIRDGFAVVQRGDFVDYP